MHKHFRLSALAVLIAMLVTAAPLHAETTATSTITQLQILEPGDSQYHLYHGVIWLEYDKSRFNYRWGGKHCDQQGVSDINLTLLFAAFRSQHKINIRYANKLHDGATYRCITGFVVARS